MSEMRPFIMLCTRSRPSMHFVLISTKCASPVSGCRFVFDNKCNPHGLQLLEDKEIWLCKERFARSGFTQYDGRCGEGFFRMSVGNSQLTRTSIVSFLCCHVPQRSSNLHYYFTYCDYCSTRLTACPLFML